jgi:hypothetical protein
MANIRSRHVVSTVGLADGLYHVVVMTDGKKQVRSLVIAH